MIRRNRLDDRCLRSRESREEQDILVEVVHVHDGEPGDQ
jgi:hypothetical protein